MHVDSMLNTCSLLAMDDGQLLARFISASLQHSTPVFVGTCANCSNRICVLARSGACAKERTNERFELWRMASLPLSFASHSSNSARTFAACKSRTSLLRIVVQPRIYWADPAGSRIKQSDGYNNERCAGSVMLMKGRG